MTNLYLIKLKKDSEEFYKVGVSVHKYCRFYQIIKETGYDVEITLMYMKIDFDKAMYLESLLLSMFNRHIPNIKFRGYSECIKSVDLQKYKSIVHKTIGEHDNIIKNIKITWR